MPQGFEKRERSTTIPTQRTYFDRIKGKSSPVTYYDGAEEALRVAGL